MSNRQVGIPGEGDVQRLRGAVAARGPDLGRTTWRCLAAAISYLPQLKEKFLEMTAPFALSSNTSDVPQALSSHQLYKIKGTLGIYSILAALGCKSAGTMKKSYTSHKLTVLCIFYSFVVENRFFCD